MPEPSHMADQSQFNALKKAHSLLLQSFTMEHPELSGAPGEAFQVFPEHLARRPSTPHPLVSAIDNSAAQAGSYSNHTRRPPTYQTNTFPASHRPREPSFLRPTTLYADNASVASRLVSQDYYDDASGGAQSTAGDFLQLDPSSSHQPNPPNFSRQPHPHLSYESFPFTYLLANDKHLDQGFPPIQPPSAMHPHPFISHDVLETDWRR